MTAKLSTVMPASARARRRGLRPALLGAALFAAPLAAMPTIADAQSIIRPTQDVVLSIGKGELVNIPGQMADVFIANDTIADIQVKSQRQLYLFGKSGGETTVYASNAAGDVIWAANVRVGSNIGSLDQMLSLAMPDAKISVATMGSNTVLLTGTVAAPEDAAEAERLVEAFLGDEANVIARLNTATPLQVNLQVRFAEVSRSLVRNLGANLATFDGTNGFQFGVARGRNSFPQFTPGGSGTFTGFDSSTPGTSRVTRGGDTTIAGLGNLFGLDIGAALDLAETNGLVSTLSQFNLSALSGNTADFLAGGEFPIPISQGLGATSVEYRNYGVKLTYTPTVLSDGRISIQVAPEVSELSAQGAVQLDGVQIPALITRRASTTAELGSGQSMMIAGLMSNNSQNLIDKAPGLGDVPILGNLFRSTEFRKGETELVIVITPYLVKPVDASDIRLPTDGYNSPDVLSQLGFKETVRENGEAVRPMPRASERQSTGPGISQAPQRGERRAGKQRRKERSASAAPGFSINN
ncbi:type II and III secretion system protein family protein [Alteriqipengyuania lutimaris]|nr:pilus assembly protein CpaC [Alteriqipengyuania lutimaris]